jgi:hypothetical protein
MLTVPICANFIYPWLVQSPDGGMSGRLMKNFFRWRTVREIFVCALLLLCFRMFFVLRFRRHSSPCGHPARLKLMTRCYVTSLFADQFALIRQSSRAVREFLDLTEAQQLLIGLNRQYDQIGDGLVAQQKELHSMLESVAEFQSDYQCILSWLQNAERTTCERDGDRDPTNESDSVRLSIWIASLVFRKVTKIPNSRSYFVRQPEIRSSGRLTTYSRLSWYSAVRHKNGASSALKIFNSTSSVCVDLPVDLYVLQKCKLGFRNNSATCP